MLNTTKFPYETNILGREYFLLGHEDVTNDRLVYSSQSVGLEWRKKYALLIEVNTQQRHTLA